MNENEFANWLAGRFRGAPSPEPPDRLARAVRADRVRAGATAAPRGLGLARLFARRSGLPAVVGLAAAACLAVGLLAIAVNRAPSGPSSASNQLSASVTASPAAVAPAPSASPAASTASGMVITDAQAIQVSGSANPVIVTAKITNRTGQADKLLGASSPLATAGGLYATAGCACTLGPSSSPDTSGMSALQLRPMPWWLIEAGGSIQLRSGDGSIVLSGLAQPLTAGQAIEVTFRFELSAPVTVTVPVVASGSQGT